jgi:hypothetical protein
MTYTPDAGYYGIDILTFYVNDGVYDSEPAGVTIEVSTQDCNAQVAAAGVPEITLASPNPMVLEPGTAYVEPGYSAVDACGGGLAAYFEIVNPVDHNRPGTYTVTYDVKDTFGNAAETARRIVYVNPDIDNHYRSIFTHDASGKLIQILKEAD